MRTNVWSPAASKPNEKSLRELETAKAELGGANSGPARSSADERRVRSLSAPIRGDMAASTTTAPTSRNRCIALLEEVIIAVHQNEYRWNIVGTLHCGGVAALAEIALDLPRRAGPDEAAGRRPSAFANKRSEVRQNIDDLNVGLQEASSVRHRGR